VADGAIEAVHTPLPGIRVEVRRSVRGGLLHERYSVLNIGEEPLMISGPGIQTPFADLYDGAERSLDRAVHAHVFTGGTWAWVLAQPMSGDGSAPGPDRAGGGATGVLRGVGDRGMGAGLVYLGRGLHRRD
jgi:hypothetical protein